MSDYYNKNLTGSRIRRRERYAPRTWSNPSTNSMAYFDFAILGNHLRNNDIVQPPTSTFDIPLSI